MVVITKLKSQKNQNRVNLYLDHKFAFGLSLNEVVKLGLSVGQKLTDLEVEKLVFSSLLEKLYNRVLNFLSFRPRSEKEIIDYLKQKLFKSKAVDLGLRKKIEKKILDKLKKDKLINDQEFASWWLEQRLSFRPKGKYLLRMELVKKGIDKNIIDQVLNRVNQEKMVELAKKVLKKKVGKVGETGTFSKDRVGKKKEELAFSKWGKRKQLALKQKLFSYLGRRGFQSSVIKRAIDESLEKR